VYSSESKLKALLDITKAISGNQSAHEILIIFSYVLKEIVGINNHVLIGCKPTWDVLNVHKFKSKQLTFDFEKSLAHINNVTYLENTDGSLADFGLVIPVFNKKTAIAYLLTGKSSVDIDISFVETITHIVAMSVENRRLFKKNIIQQIHDHELKIASEIQQFLIPTNFLHNPFIQVHGVYMPHNQIGGDYYDLIPSGEDFYFCMADVSGKGISAAILMANFQAQLRTLINYTDFSLFELITELNKQVNVSVKGEKFITLFLGKYETKERKLSYVNAGHNPPILIKKNKSSILSKGTVGLGMMNELPFLNVAEIAIDPGTIISCYTDGIIEQLNKTNEEYSLEKLEQKVIEYHNFHPSLINAGILKSMEEHRGEQAYNDDISLFSCRFI
jgi:sigma-B regulation protein RsbU (phosphoserine phosphatase)